MKIKKVILIFTIMLAISGCTNNGNNKTQIKTLEKAPKALGDTYEELSKVLDSIGKIERINLDIDVKDQERSSGDQKQQKPTNGEQSQDTQDSGSGQDSGTGSGSQESNNKVSQDKSEQSSDKKPDEKIKEIWKDIDKSLEDIYQKWSGYENEGIKKGASKDSVSKFKDSINKLTASVEEEDTIKIYEFGSQSLLNLKPFFSLYKDEYRGEICDLKYSIYQFYVKAITNDKESAKSAVIGKEENINKIRMLISDNEEKIKNLEKVSSSLENMDISLEEDSRMVYVFEKDTMIKNLESLE